MTSRDEARQFSEGIYSLAYHQLTPAQQFVVDAAVKVQASSQSEMVRELVGALERLASNKSMTGLPRAATEEETARMLYAEAALSRFRAGETSADYAKKRQLHTTGETT